LRKPIGRNFSCASRDTTLHKYGMAQPVDTLEGRIVAIADVVGDWREELILTAGGRQPVAGGR
jgi:hypothetical protein